MGIKRYHQDFIRDFRTKGLKKAFQNCVCELIGVKDQIETLQFFLNQMHSPSSVGPTSDNDLRIMQLCDAALLAIFDKFCKKYHLSYWLDYGTLLGAVRHKGFIPWDDDMDIAMPRKDFDKAVGLMKQELEPFGLEVHKMDIGIIGLSYHHTQTGIWLDIFPIDDLYSEEKIDKVEKNISDNINKYRSFWKRRKRIKDDAYFVKMRNEYINNKCKSGEEHIWYHCPEFKYVKNVMHTHQMIFPLQKINFEGYDLSAPNMLEDYLEGIYGKNYMGFPRTGVLHHDFGRGALSTWAKRNHIDMNDVLDVLNKIESQI